MDGVCGARIHPFTDGTEIICERLQGHIDMHEGVLRDYAYVGSQTRIHWDERDRRNYYGEWEKCPEWSGCILPRGHYGRHAQ